jgi:uridine phosphorylase
MKPLQAPDAARHPPNQSPKTIMHYTLAENIAIKTALPPFGIVCSNPNRAQRLVKNLSDTTVHPGEWGLNVTIGTCQGLQIAIVPIAVGGAGAGFAAHEMLTAGCKYLVRYGSNDRPFTIDNLRDLIVVRGADNLHSLPHILGDTAHADDTLIPASADLLAAFAQSAAGMKKEVIEAVCHHVEDYHAYVYPDCIADATAREHVKNHIRQLEGRYPHNAWDMESAALFFRAQQFDLHAITVLQSVLKPRGNDVVYQGQAGEIAREMEAVFWQWIMGAFGTLQA